VVLHIFSQKISKPELVKKEIFKIVGLSFKEYLNFTPISSGKLMKKTELLELIFYKLPILPDITLDISTTFLQSIKSDLFTSLTEAHLSSDLRNLGDFSACLTNLLSYKHGQILSHKELFQALFEIFAMSSQAIALLSAEIT
jgi:hypothetical protein